MYTRVHFSGHYLVVSTGGRHSEWSQVAHPTRPRWYSVSSTLQAGHHGTPADRPRRRRRAGRLGTGLGVAAGSSGGVSATSDLDALDAFRADSGNFFI